ncbi:polyprenyl synthetase family protein [Acidobacteriota bacterium]
MSDSKLNSLLTKEMQDSAKFIHTLYLELLKPIRKKLDLVEIEIEKELKSDIEIISRMNDYIGKSKGKRIRPALFLLCSRLMGVKSDRDVLFATVMEFIHTATLIHDDIIDEAETRRGQKTVNAIWGNELTVLLGDLLYLKAVNLSLKEKNVDILGILTDITIKMIEGEIIQLSNRGTLHTSEKACMEIVHRKTAHLFEACGRISAILADAPPEQKKAIADYCRNLGIAFQLVDDILDFVADTNVLGKPVANDLCEGNVTLPLVYALKEANKEEHKKVQDILEGSGPEKADRKWVLSLLEKYGALDKTIKEAGIFADQATAALTVFPDSDTKEILAELPTFVVARHF